MEYVKTNLGIVPLTDYYEMVAVQNGFEFYSEMKEDGYSIEKPQIIVI